jgi:beta-glucosidase-like glycosyl hydrolase
MQTSAKTLTKIAAGCAIAASALFGTLAMMPKAQAQEADHKKFTLVADADARAEKILSKMTLEEKIDYIGGEDSMYVRALPRLGLPAFKMSDGPLGVRGTGDSTAYPAGIMEAANWNPELEYQVGRMVAYDAKARGVTTMLGPGMNIYRAPMCGRNFEYFGEDPFLASRMAVAVIEGMQSEGVIATAKHYMGHRSARGRDHGFLQPDQRRARHGKQIHQHPSGEKGLGIPGRDHVRLGRDIRRCGGGKRRHGYRDAVGQIHESRDVAAGGEGWPRVAGDDRR